MAAAAKSGRSTSSTSPTTGNSCQGASQSERSLAVHQKSTRLTPGSRKAHRRPKETKRTRSYPEEVRAQSPRFPDGPTAYAMDLASSGSESSHVININNVPSPVQSITSGWQSPTAVTKQAGSRSQEQSHVLVSITANTNRMALSNSSSTAQANLGSLAKRTQKLEAQLEAIQDISVPNKDEYNNTIQRLYQHSSTSAQSVTSMEQFGHILGQLGNISSAVGIIYSLLSWEIFRWEEERLVRDEGKALLVAAKQINDKMAEVSHRRARAKDWASDGRKAAGMVFGAIADLSTIAQSIALLSLVGCITLDGLLKIAHFPLLREHFRTNFARIAESRQKEWESLAANHYLVFDYQAVLRNGFSAHGRRSSRRTSSGQLSSQDAIIYALPSPPPSDDVPYQPRVNTNMENALNRRDNYESDTILHHEIDDISIMDIDLDYSLFEHLQAADLSKLPNNLQYNMGIALTTHS
ncbi:hypothetical protein MMC25_006350 [Agyrium rufum]|nr:hypothetical protein [Agyrium rufum]